jgi:predicted CoA-binding protein
VEVVEMMFHEVVAQDFLAQHRVALVGASENPKSFGNTIYRELRDHGYEVIPVNPGSDTVEGDRCYPDLASVPGDVDAVMVMVHRDAAADVVRACIERGVGHVWLFKGVGGPGAVSDEAADLCRQNGIHVVAGACPLMFLEPVAWFHRAHRAIRHLNGSLAKAS